MKESTVTDMPYSWLYSTVVTEQLLRLEAASRQSSARRSLISLIDASASSLVSRPHLDLKISDSVVPLYWGDISSRWMHF